MLGNIEDSHKDGLRGWQSRDHLIKELARHGGARNKILSHRIDNVS